VGIFAALLDRRPDYLEDEAGHASLLLVPLTTGSLICELHARVEAVCRDSIAVVSTFEPTPSYAAAIRGACPQVKDVLPVHEFLARFSAYDLKDWLVIIDPACFPLAPIDWAPIEAELARPQAGALHIVALDEHPGGTTERVQLDPAGRVRRIQRYYDSHTWAFTRGIACSIVPAAALVAANCVEFRDLRELRQELMLRGVPSRDLPLVPGALDLENPGALLHLAEVCMRATEGAEETHTVDVAQTAVVDPTAELIGPVFVHDDALVEAGARVIGPTVIGRGARVGRDAIVAQCVLAPAARVRSGSTHRHAVIAGTHSSASAIEVHDDPAPMAEIGLQPAEHAGSSSYTGVKAVVDAAIAAVSLVILSPFLLLTAALIKLESRGPALYGDLRETIGGRTFRCWKFRTMCRDAAARQRELLNTNEVDGPQFKMDADPRVTRLGAWLRRLSIDELPQLINVVRGEMSLVGPRPSPFRENQICIPWREARLSVRPGITGLWQVCRAERNSGDFHQWIHYDLLYVRNISFAVDVKLIGATVLTLLSGKRVPVTWVLPAAALRPAAKDETVSEDAYDSAHA